MLRGGLRRGISGVSNDSLMRGLVWELNGEGDEVNPWDPEAFAWTKNAEVNVGGEDDISALEIVSNVITSKISWEVLPVSN